MNWDEILDELDNHYGITKRDMKAFQVLLNLKNATGQPYSNILLWAIVGLESARDKIKDTDQLRAESDQFFIDKMHIAMLEMYRF